MLLYPWEISTFLSVFRRAAAAARHLKRCELHFNKWTVKCQVLFHLAFRLFDPARPFRTASPDDGSPSSSSAMATILLSRSFKSEAGSRRPVSLRSGSGDSRLGNCDSVRNFGMGHLRVRLNETPVLNPDRRFPLPRRQSAPNQDICAAESQQSSGVQGQEAVRAQLSFYFLLGRGGLDGWRRLMTFCSCAATWSRGSRSL